MALRPAQHERRSTGLCGQCAHAETIVSVRGSTFSLCRLSELDARFPKYPVLPVMACEGYSAAPADDPDDSPR